MDDLMFDPTIQSVGDLIQKANKLWEKRTLKIKEQMAVEKEKLEKAQAQESTLLAKISKGKKLIGKLQRDYFKLEAKIQKEKTSAVMNRELKVEDVKSGRASVSEFYRRGKNQQELSGMAIDEFLNEIDGVLDMIRAESKSIIELEYEKAKLRNVIANLSYYPAKGLSQAHSEQIKYINFNMNILYEDVMIGNSQLKQKEAEIHLMDGKSLGSGYAWNRIAFEEAKNIKFSAIMPKNLIADLMKQLLPYEGTESLLNVKLNLGMNIKTPSISVSPIMGFGNKKEIKAVSTANLNIGG